MAKSYVGATGTRNARAQRKTKGDRKWTVMVFMGADTIDGNAPLGDAAKDDLEEMAFVGSGGLLNVMVQVHGLGKIPQRGRLRAGSVSLRDVPEGQREPDDGQALESFIGWALDTAGHNAPDDYSMLVLWGHAYDFAFGRRRTRSGAIDALDFAELADVLKRLQQRFGSPDAKLDILAFDACDLATVEMACQLEPFASYLLGSQIGIPIPGWPYDRILHRLRYPKSRLMGPAELGSYAVRRFCESYPPTSPVSLTLLDLAFAGALSAHAEFLALTLVSVIGQPDSRDRIAELFLRSQTGERRPYVDVADLCLNLVRESGDAFVAEAARALGDFLVTPRFPLAGGSATGMGRPFVVEHGGNSGQTARLNGISIYAPHVAPDIDFDAVRDLYHNFIFAKKTRWSGLVHTLARLG